MHLILEQLQHRFSKEQTAWKTIQELEPCLIFRFGATFPMRTSGKGKTKKTERDYDNLVYDLNADESFNQRLVKGIDVYYPAIKEQIKK
ncbi:MAG: hypothetical protein LBT89_08310 [Planctomycetaceae bacterium]|jgi:type III restriction enzyme|nr:hypothetical protein [Planctomycetaceae bacterium]